MELPTELAELDPAQQAFLRNAVLNGAVWGLEDEEGWALAASTEGETVMVFPLWSSQQAAAACAEGDWAGYRASPVSLDDLLEHWLPGMQRDGYRVGVDWNAGLEGVEVPPLELQADLEQMVSLMDAEGLLPPGSETEGRD
ncbi:MAG: DUF2750 domain-containing protein [Ectothiorhodospiraceae bacterium]|nr:DUF2750 domain-containing protein [Ectothiorhodospiraceae bacterium]